MKNKKIKIFFAMVFLIGILLINFASAQSYSRANPNYGAFNSYVESSEMSEAERCSAGQDFLIQIAPFGCTPAVVRSDLLEEQNVPVFCQLAATQINPLIDVEAIESISFSGEYPEAVSGISFHPARAALGVSGDLNSPILENIGYVVIVLKKEEVEDNMPEFVKGNLTATIRYDIKNAFGIGRASFYLPELTDSDFEDHKNQFSFWSGKGYLRAESVDENSAQISIYNDLRKVSTQTLKKGETSNKISMPNLDCLANLKLRLDGIEAPDTKARFEINGEIIEVTEKEYFLDNACRITKLDKKGIVETVNVRCRTDDGVDSFSLKKSSHVNLTICDKNGENCKTGDYGFGDILYSSEDRNVFVGYLGEDKGKAYILPVVSTANTKKAFLESIDQDFIEVHVKFLEEEKSVTNLVKRGSAFMGIMVNAIGRGSDFGYRIFEGEGLKDADFLFNDLGNTILGTAGSGSLVGVAALLFTGPLGAVVIGIGVGALALAGMEAHDLFFQEERKISFNGFSSGRDIELSGDAKQNYETAMADYDRVLNSYSKEPCAGYENCGEEAMYKKIILAFDKAQRLTASRLCDEFKSTYPNSNLSLGSYCDDKFKLANQELSSHEVVINNRVKRISFDGIIEPSWEEFSAEITVKTKEETYSYILLKDKKVNLNNEFFYLRDLDLEYATFDVSNINYGTVSEAFSGGPSNLKIKLDECKLIGKNSYEICVNKINLKNVAKVSVIPNIDNAGTSANFSFAVGIEKRSIQLSPDEIEDKINNLNDSIDEWQDKSDSLGKVVKGLKGACLATEAYLTVKNFLSNTGGKGIARNQVMTDTGGWNDRCADLEYNGNKYSSFEDCIFSNSEEIDKEVDERYKEITKQNEEIKVLENGCPKQEFLTEVNIDTDCFKDKLTSSVKSDLEKNLDRNKIIKVGNENVTVSQILEGLDVNSTSIEQLRSLQLNSRIDNDMAKAQVEADLKDIYVNSKEKVEAKSFSDNAIGVKNPDVDSFGSKDSVTGIYRGGEAASDNPVLNEGTPVKMITFDGEKYYLELEKTKNNEYRIANVYDTSWTRLTDSKEEAEQSYDVQYDSKVKDITGTISVFKKYDKSSYENPFKSVSGETGVVVKFFETEPYKGLPALVPFDLEEGWYAATKQTLSTLGGIKAYDESGRVTSLWVCNVGENQIAEFKTGVNDDICRQVNLGTGATYTAFPYLEPSEATKIVTCAVEAIKDASNYKSGSSDVRISTSCGGSHSFKVGSPAVDLPEMQCTDTMSPDECKLLFNVCDPVICPSSRCDLGGSYPVKDVIQSGIIGSIALCLPNIKEGIYVPVCLTGIKAGIDGYLSVLKAHRDCLQESLDSGETVGICDEIYSINMCEFFWRQGLPLAKLVLPKLIGALLGQNVHGGGEYIGITNAWTNAEQSINFFTQYYAANSFKAFKARSAEEVGGEVCKNFASGVFPDGGDLLDSLTEPDSPAQFHGRFDEIPFTTVTVPAISQYKVFYHIYAGEDQGVYYQVYLTEGDESSFYQDTSYRRIVDSGYIKKGDYADETKDFTAPTGYKKLCIRVNEQEECGFKQVSTSYAVNYVEDKYLEEQVSQTDIKTESECISGTASAYSLVSPNLQEGVNEVVDPAIYNRGIIRICSTDNPGKGTDESRWSEVGYCDNEKIKCWIDMDSISNVIDDLNIENNTLNDLANYSLSILINDGTCMKRDEVEEKIKEKEILMEQGKYIEAIELINSIIDKVCWNDQMIRLLFNRGDAYSNLVKVPKVEVIEEDFDSQTGNDEINWEGDEELVCEKTKCGTASATGGSTSVTETQYIMGGDECLAETARNVISEANKVRDEQIGSKPYLSNEEVSKQIGVSSFGCLAAMVARQEGCLAHCKYKEGESDPLYCRDGEKANVITGDKGDAIGIMQISKDKHGEHYGFSDNVNYASNLLIRLYKISPKSYSCLGVNYVGWEAALRGYNGWPPSGCSGDPDYVDKVLARKNEIISLVPNCAVDSETLCKNYCEENSEGETFYSYSGLTSSQCDGKETEDPFSYSENLNCCCYFKDKGLVISGSGDVNNQ